MWWGRLGTGAPDDRRKGLGRAMHSGREGVGHRILGLAWKGHAEGAEIVGSGSVKVHKMTWEGMWENHRGCSPRI